MHFRRRHRGTPRASLSLKIAALAGLLFLHIPLALIILYAFTTEDKSYQFPPPGLTLKWFAVAWNRPDIWSALTLSVKVACVSTFIALVLGTLASAAIYRTKFFGREAISLLIILPIALPGIIGSSRLFIGQAVFLHQGTAGNIPMAAAFSVVPIVIMAVYLTVAKRLGAFDAL